VAVGRLEETAGPVCQFEEWLLDSYDAITRTSAFAPYLARETLGSLAGRSPVLFVVVDGLPWHGGMALRNLLGDEDVACGAAYGAVTSIPSITPAAKPALVRGQLPGQLEAPQQAMEYYTQLFAESLNVPLQDVACGTDRTTDLRELVCIRRKGYLYLFNAIDEIIHKPLSQEKRREDLTFLLRRLAKDIAQARSEFRSLHHQDLAIVIASDHGYSELPDECETATTTAEEGTCSVKAARVVQLNSGRHHEDEGFVFVGPDLLGGANAAFMVAKGYRCVGSKPRGAVHGGLTPQEMVVPCLVFDPAEEIVYSDVEVAISGSVRRGRADNPVSVRLVNPNPIAVDVNDIDIRLVTTELRLPLPIEAHDVTELQAVLDARDVREKTVDLAGKLVVNVRGKEHTTEFAFTVPTIGAALVDKSFEDEFDM